MFLWQLKAVECLVRRMSTIFRHTALQKCVPENFSSDKKRICGSDLEIVENVQVYVFQVGIIFAADDVGDSTWKILIVVLILKDVVSVFVAFF